MSFDYSSIGVVISAIGVLIALTALVIEVRRSRLATQVDLLMRIEDKFESREMIALREIAAKKLLEKDLVNNELGKILGFFAMISFLYLRKVIDTELIYTEYSYWMVRYWLCAQAYVDQERRIDPQCFLTLERVVSILKDREQEHGYSLYTQEILSAFLEKEAGKPISIL